MKILIAVVLFASSQSFAGNAAQCISGKAGNFPCSSIHLMSVTALTQSGLPAKTGNDIWGWTDPLTQREYAIMGLSSKASFIDITDPKNPQHLGDLPTQTRDSAWRDIKVYKDHAFIVSEAFNHGMQVFDLTQLRNVKAAPVKFSVTTHYNGFGSAHNIVINEDSGFAYAVGSNKCDAGMHVVDIRDPRNPKFATCVDKSIFEPVRPKPSPDPAFHGEDYTHDAQCVNYDGPDNRYTGKEICICSNADTVNIVDVTDKAKTSQISVTGYKGRGYTHQGWLTEDHRYFFLGDELDEMRFKHNTKTIIWDLKDLTKPVRIGEFVSTSKSVDHNMYVKGNYLFQANYTAGLRILNISDVANASLKEVAYFDTVPSKDLAKFEGAWSIYPYFASGNVVISNIDGQLFVVKPNLP